MPVIDVQVHPFDRNHPGRPWASPSHGLPSATGVIFGTSGYDVERELRAYAEVAGLR